MCVQRRSKVMPALGSKFAVCVSCLPSAPVRSEQALRLVLSVCLAGLVGWMGGAGMARVGRGWVTRPSGVDDSSRPRGSHTSNPGRGRIHNNTDNAGDVIQRNSVERRWREGGGDQCGRALVLQRLRLTVVHRVRDVATVDSPACEPKPQSPRQSCDESSTMRESCYLIHSIIPAAYGESIPPAAHPPISRPSHS